MAPDKPEDTKNIVSELIRRMNEDRRRIKLLEQDIERMKSNMSSLENAALAQMAEMRVTLEKMNVQVQALSSRVGSIEASLARVGKEIGKAATKIELRQIESFIDLVNPITSKFVTKDELDRALDEFSTRRSAVRG